MELVNVQTTRIALSNVVYKQQNNKASKIPAGLSPVYAKYVWIKNKMRACRRRLGVAWLEPRVIVEYFNL